jgi:hypothetical protein
MIDARFLTPDDAAREKGVKDSSESLESDSSDDLRSYVIDLAGRNGVDISGLSIYELMAGVPKEMEHAIGNDGAIEDSLGALKIAVDNLRSDPVYYTKLLGAGLMTA